MLRRFSSGGFFLCLLFFGAGFCTIDAAEEIDFNRDIRPLLSNRCNACHGPDEEKRKADLRLDTLEGALMDLGGYAALVPGDPEASELLYRITTDDEDDLMPPSKKGARFTEAETDLIRRWIEQGGKYDAHWSYAKPKRPELPKTIDPTWSKHPVDQFILTRLEKEGLAPSKRADRLSLARRLSLDLIGLPPTWEQAKAFRDDVSPGALEKYVDSLLAKPAFGERWARVWLDLARYADSAGYADDPLRTIWAYRDYVIRSLNSNKPFDQFTIEQVAGDLMENPSDEQLIATAFHRNTLTNSEGGTNDEEFRNVAIVDRVNTTMAVWMGTTMACAQCHTHKYDPLTHQEYFQLFDFFNQSADVDRKDEAPLFEVWKEEQKKEKARLSDEIQGLEKILSTSTPMIDQEREAWLGKWNQQYGWTSLEPGEAVGKNVGFTKESDSWILASPVEANDCYELSFDLSKLESKQVAGIRIEISPEQDRNFVLSQVRAVYEPSGDENKVKGRYVRVELPGKVKTLQLAEVEVFVGDENVALKKPVSESSVYASAIGENANDGNTNGDYQAGSVFHSIHQDDPWLEIDLGEERVLDRIVIWNRTDGGESISGRILGYRVRVLDSEKREVYSESPSEVPLPKEDIWLNGERSLPISLASASHEQSGFPASAVLGAKVEPGKGWAISGGVGKPQELILVLEKPLLETGGVLRLELDQASSYENHLLRNFRISFTSKEMLSEWAKLPASLRSLIERRASLTAEEQENLKKQFLTIAPSLEDERRELENRRKKLASIKPYTSVPILTELPPEKRRETHVHLRGAYLSHGDKATAGVPAVFHPLENDIPKNRLALAHWLVDEENPLTPRVLANRFWEQLFGIGIVETSEEFGAQGELPSHPELLDWLAVELRDSGWDIKAFLKLLVTSEAYQQNSAVTPEMMESDPYNRLLSRGPRFRISAEMVRDQTLAVAGLLSDKMYGPPVNPPQPELGLKAAFGSKTDWETSKGEDRYRRGIYTRWRRSSPYPSMATFDAPNREVCTVRRTRTNTPLQALVTMNDPVYVEAAQSWGRLASALPGGLKEQLAVRLRDTLIREPDASEVKRLEELYEDALEIYRADLESARAMAEDPIGKIPEGADLASLAAWTVVGNVVLNLDELFLKR